MPETSKLAWTAVLDGACAPVSRGCAPQIAQGDPSLPCVARSQFYWNGPSCALRDTCDCQGRDCDDGFDTREACEVAYAACMDSRKHCWGFGGRGCAPDEYSHVPPESACGVLDAGGSCQPKPMACEAVDQPVCACGGVTYANDCEAALADPQVALSSYRACP